MPKWATIERKTYLVNLFHDSNGFCVYGHKNCTNPEHHYINYIDDLIRDWIASDRRDTIARYQAEYNERHRLRDRLPLRGQFSGIAKDIYYDHQPLFYIENIGINGVTFKPFIKIRICSSNTHIYVDISNTLKSMSKNARRRLIRHACKDKYSEILNPVCINAVKDYLK